MHETEERPLPVKGTPEYEHYYRPAQPGPSGTPICGARTRAGHPCRNTAIMTNGRCRMHRGNSNAGIGHPNFKHGRYSRYLPGDLLERYEEARRDPDLLAMKEEIALLDARLGDLLNRVMQGESRRLWGMVQDAYEQLKQAIRAKDATGMAFELSLLEDVIERGINDYDAWDAISGVIEQRRKIVETERKRLVDMQQMITAERAMVLVSVLQDSVRRHVDDPAVLAAIAGDIRAAFSVGPGGRAVAGNEQ